MNKPGGSMFKYLSILVIAVALITNCTKAPDAEKAKVTDPKEVKTSEPSKQVDTKTAATDYKLDLAKSSIKWIGTKKTGRHNGVVKIKSGKFSTKDDQIVGGEFTIDMPTAETLDLSGAMKEKLDKHLKSVDFFDVEKFPEAKFVIVKITPDATDKKKATVTGNLTIKGITKEISFTANIASNEQKKPASATANFNLDRKLWNLVYKGKADDLIRDEINFELDLKTQL